MESFNTEHKKDSSCWEGDFCPHRQCRALSCDHSLQHRPAQSCSAFSWYHPLSNTHASSDDDGANPESRGLSRSLLQCPDQVDFRSNRVGPRSTSSCHKRSGRKDGGGAGSRDLTPTRKDDASCKTVSTGGLSLDSYELWRCLPLPRSHPWAKGAEVAELAKYDPGTFGTHQWLYEDKSHLLGIHDFS